MIKYFFYAIIALMVSTVTAVSHANGSETSQAPHILVIVTDSSREAYGPQLKDEVISQLQKQLNGSVAQYDIRITNNDEADKLKQVRETELPELANRFGYDQVALIDLLPIKADFSDYLFYKAIKSEAIVRICLYDAINKQYRLTEEVTGTGINKTYIPYTSVGKKPAAGEAVRKAARAAAEKIKQTRLQDTR